MPSQYEYSDARVAELTETMYTVSACALAMSLHFEVSLGLPAATNV